MTFWVGAAADDAAIDYAYGRPGNDIGDDGISTLVNLTALYLGDVDEITDEGITSLQSLTVLDLGQSFRVTSRGIAQLRTLVELTLAHPSQFNESDLEHLVHLERLTMDTGDPPIEIERSGAGQIEWPDAMDIDSAV